MESQFLYEDILGMLAQIKDDEKKLMTVFACLEKQLSDGDKRDKENRLLAEYENTILQIADAVYSGAVCYLDPETMELQSIQRETFFDESDENDLSDSESDGLALNAIKWQKQIAFRLPGSNKLLDMMEEYVTELKDSILGSKLVRALEDYTPISSFLKVISECGYNDDWLQFRKKETVAYVNSIFVKKIQPAGG